MRILFVVKNLRLSNGVASYVMNYYRELIKNEDVKIDFLEVSHTSCPYYEEIKRHGSKVYQLPSYKRELLKIPSFLIKIYKEGKYDIVHSNVVSSASLILHYAKRFKVPLRILHSHATQNGDSTLKAIIRYPLKKIALKNSNCYFACSKLAGNFLFKNKKFYIINNAIDIEKYKYDIELRREIRTKYNSEEKQIIMTVGRITKIKNPYFIVKIIEEISKVNNNFEFWWLGSGDLDDKIKQTIINKKLDKKVIFFGNTSNVNEFYSAADIFILPSFSEGLPVVVIEAQISGLQCLLSDKITKEVKIGRNNCSFLPITNSKIWIDTITSSMEYNREKNIKDLNYEKYRISEQANKMLSIYEDKL